MKIIAKAVLGLALLSGSALAQSPGYMTQNSVLKSIKDHGVQLTAQLSCRDPNSYDDVTAGYKVGDSWVNHCAKRNFANIRNTAGQAAWRPVSWVSAPLVDAVSSASPNLVGGWAARKLKNSYNGSAMDVVANAISTTVSYISATGLIDEQAIAAFSGGISTTVSRLSDQSGNGYDLGVSGTVQNPVWNGYKLNGYPAFTFDGNSRAQDNNSPLFQNPSTPYFLDSFSAFYIGRINSVKNDGVIFQLGLPAAGRVSFLYVDHTSGLRMNPYSGVMVQPPSMPSVIGVMNSSATVTSIANDLSMTTVSATAHTPVTGTEIMNSTANTFRNTGDMHAALIFNRVLTPSETSQFLFAAYDNFGIVPQVRKWLMPIGTSIDAGFDNGGVNGTSATALNMNFTNLLKDQVKEDVGVYNFGLNSSFTSSWTTPGVNGLASATNVLAAGNTYYSLIDMCTNDITLGNALGAACYTSVTAIMTNLRASATTVGANLKVGIATVLPRNGISRTQVDIFNNLVKANSAGADYVVDHTANIPMVNGASDTTLMVDLIHPSQLGHQYLVSDWYRAIKAWLP